MTNFESITATPEALAELMQNCVNCDDCPNCPHCGVMMDLSDEVHE